MPQEAQFKKHYVFVGVSSGADIMILGLRGVISQHSDQNHTNNFSLLRVNFSCDLRPEGLEPVLGNRLRPWPLGAYREAAP